MPWKPRAGSGRCLPQGYLGHPPPPPVDQRPLGPPPRSSRKSPALWIQLNSHTPFGLGSADLLPESFHALPAPLPASPGWPDTLAFEGRRPGSVGRAPAASQGAQLIHPTTLVEARGPWTRRRGEGGLLCPVTPDCSLPLLASVCCRPGPHAGVGPRPIRPPPVFRLSPCCLSPCAAWASSPLPCAGSGRRLPWEGNLVSVANGLLLCNKPPETEWLKTRPLLLLMTSASIEITV